MLIDGVQDDARMRHYVVDVVVVAVQVFVRPVGEVDLGARFPAELPIAVHVGKSDPGILKDSKFIIFKVSEIVLEKFIIENNIIMVVKMISC